jgi:TPR repeat protein
LKVPLGPPAVFALLLFALPISSLAQSKPNVPDQYKRFFLQYSDQRSLYEKALNSVGLTSLRVGRSYALIAGVTQYPNFPPLQRSLKPAAVDIEKLKAYLRDQEFFDEIVVLKDGDVNLDNLNYFLQNYFPDRLAHSPHSRFLFAYTGHGYAEGSEDTARGFLLTSPAVSNVDPVNRIDLSVLRTLLDPDIDSAEKVLVLINACQSGAFLGRKSFGPNPLGPGDRGAHAIMASRSNQQSLQVANVGPGSVFFEKIFAGLEGAADNAPRDGVITYHELDSYLHSEIPYATNGSQIPMEGDISRNGSVGEFFFLNQRRQVQAGNAKPWDAQSAVAFGEKATDLVQEGRLALDAQRYDDARMLFLRAAGAGNDDAMTLVGYLYFFGFGVSKDYGQAREWFEKGVAAGNRTAMYNLAGIYRDGYGVPQDFVQARKWYEKAAAAGDATAMTSLGILFDNGQGVPQDYQQARQWYEKGAAAGYAIAMDSLGKLYAEGHGVKQDYGQARQWFEKAAAAGDATAMTYLGVLFDKGQGVPQDYQQARQWYEKGAAAGDVTAMYNLGGLYANGHGVTQDYVQARQWYEKAAAAGYATAMTYLGVLFDNGQGVARDYQQARQWYEKAAAGGDAIAMLNLGGLYADGRGVTQDYGQARMWYQRAADAGDKTALDRLGKLPK